MSDEYSEYESQRYIEQRLAQLSGKSNTRFDEVDQRQALQESALRKESVASSLGQVPIREQETTVSNTNEQVSQTVQTEQTVQIEQSSVMNDVTNKQAVQIEQSFVTNDITSEQADSGLVETTVVGQQTESETNETNVVDTLTQENVQINQSEQSIVYNEQITNGLTETTVVNDEQVSTPVASNETSNKSLDAFLMEYEQYVNEHNDLRSSDCKIARAEITAIERLQAYCQEHSIVSGYKQEPLNIYIVLSLLIEKFLKESEEQ